MYGKACDLYDRLFETTRSFPREFRFELTSQILRAASSVYANIAEGCQRPSQAEYAYFIGIAYASAGELQAHLERAPKNGLIWDPEILALATEVKKMLYALLRFLRGL